MLAFTGLIIVFIVGCMIVVGIAWREGRIILALFAAFLFGYNFSFLIAKIGAKL